MVVVKLGRDHRRLGSVSSDQILPKLIYVIITNILNTENWDPKWIPHLTYFEYPSSA